MMEALTACPAWLKPEALALMQRAQSQKFPHALLLSGVPGIGKRAFGQWLCESLLCRQPGESGRCGQCESCHQLLAGAHPDFRKIAPENKQAVIKIDTIRELVDWMHLTASQHSYRIAFIEAADSLNRNAANALLKTLEEPADGAVLILTATRVGSLAATIRSRCQKVVLRVSDKSAALAWLDGKVSNPQSALTRTQGGPFAAVQNSSDDQLAIDSLLLKAWKDLFLHRGSVGRITDSLSEMDTAECLSVFSHWTVAAVKKRSDVVFGSDPAIEQAISDTCQCLGNEQWFTLYDRLLQLHRSDSSSFKTQTVLEGLFADIRLMISE